MSHYISEDVLGEFYKNLIGEGVRRVHIPRSEVFYTRTHLEQVFDREFSLDYIERCLFLEGFLSKGDVFEPERKRPWESQTLDQYWTNSETLTENSKQGSQS